MTYSEPLLTQFNYFFFSLGFGMLLDVWYVLVMFVRMCISKKKWVIITADVVFSITVSVFSFFFMVIYNNGQVRLNLIAGQALGAVALHLTVGRKILFYMQGITVKIQKLVSFLFIPAKSFILLLKRPWQMLKNKSYKKKEKGNVKNSNFLKKINIITKRLLQNKNKSV